MKLNKIIYDIRESVKEYIDDGDITDRYILHLLNIKRSKYLRQELNNSQRSFNNSIIQTLTVPLEQVSVSECDININGCDTILRSCKMIPDVLQLHNKDAISKVSSINLTSKPFNYKNINNIIYAGESSFPNSIYAFLNNDGYMYITSSDDAINLLECISVSGIFEDPTELKNFSKCCNCEDEIEYCFSFEDEYPITPHLLDIIIEEITIKLLRKKQLDDDKINNGSDE